MLAIEFRLKISSMYSIRVPYSYQCARTYPLPAPSTIKGLCANALWRKEGGNPAVCLENIQKETIGATARAEYPILVSSCTVAMVPKNALLRQFAFTPCVDCLIAFKDDAGEKLGKRVAEALKVSPVYLGDSESLASVMPESVNIMLKPFDRVNKGEQVTVNSTVKFAIINNGRVHTSPVGKGVVLYMQENPIETNAVLERYLAPLEQEGDNYYPLHSFNFETARDCFLIRGQRLTGIIPEKEPVSEIEKPKRGRKEKHLKTLTLTLRSDRPVEENAAKLRGFFATRFTEYALLHQHIDVDKLLYRYPRIQYKILEGDAIVLGIEEGAEVLKEIYDKYDEIILGDSTYTIVERG